MYLKIIILFITFVYMAFLRQRYKQVGTSNYNKARKRFATVVVVFLILQSGLRHLYIGPDTIQYYFHFSEDINLSWSTIIQNFYSVYQLGEGKDAGYVVIEKLFSYLSTDYQMYLLFVATAIFVPIIRLVYKNTERIEDIWLALLIYYALFYHFFSVTGIRQTIATAICLCSIDYIRKRKLWIFTTCIILAAFIHKTALIFYPFYWIYNVKKVKLLFIGSIVSFPVMTVMGYEFTIQLALFSGSENYIGYADEGSRGAINLILFYFSICLIAFWKYRMNLDFLEKHCSVFNAVSIGLLLFPLSFNSPNLVRLTQYYSIYILVILGYINIPKKGFSRRAILSIIILLLLYKIVLTSDNYAFFWEYYIPKI